MRSNGVPESHITGSAKPYEKFLAFARTMPRLLRNPLWHWTHLELDRVFGIKEILNEDTAPKIWAKANDKLKSLSAQKILKQFRVRVVGTTDDPCDDLAHHQKIQKSGIGTRVYPTFRPDKALLVDQPAIFSTWVQRLEKTSGVDCSSFHGFLKALDQRHEFFHQLGSRISDHGMNQTFGRGGTREQATRIYTAARKGESPTPEDHRLPIERKAEA